MNCSNCGFQMNGEYDFCPECGMRIVKRASYIVPQEAKKEEKKKGKTSKIKWVAIICGLVVIGAIIYGLYLREEYERRYDELAAVLYGDEDKAQIEPEVEPVITPEVEPVITPEVEPVITPEADSEENIINVWSFTDEVPILIQEYVDAHPDFGYEIRTNIVSTIDGEYQPALDGALVAGGAKRPDIYCVESAYALKYTQGDASSYAATYEELGIDVDANIKKAEIADYVVQVGTRPSDGNVVGLGYQGSGGAFIYRRSIAMDTWGTDDPTAISEIIGGGSGEWNSFLVAAQDLKKKGYAIVSGNWDVWRPIENSASKGWIVEDKLHIDPKREAYLDLARVMNEEGYTNKTTQWMNEWFDDIQGLGEKEVFGFFGPVWLVNYTLMPNSSGYTLGDGTYGDWAVCDSPTGFFWGGTWVLAHKDTDKKEAVADILEWLTLDCTKDGLQYAWANGWSENYSVYGKNGATSNVVLKMADGSSDFLGGQNMYEVYSTANQVAKGNNVSPYDETINAYWYAAVEEYASGRISRVEAIQQFKDSVRFSLGLESE